MHLHGISVNRTGRKKIEKSDIEHCWPGILIISEGSFGPCDQPMPGKWLHFVGSKFRSFCGKQVQDRLIPYTFPESIRPAGFLFPPAAG